MLIENPGIRYCMTDDADPELPTYFIPVSAGLVLGGTAEVGQWDTTVDREQRMSILDRCAALEPSIRGARILAVKSGLRPGRDKVRLEVETIAGGQTVIHNYGHGGSGFTLAWGCAQEVVRMVRSCSPERRR